MLNRPQIKADARLLIRTAAVSPLMMSAIVLLIVFLLDRVSDLAEYGSLFYSYTYNAAYLDALLAGNVSALPDALPALVGDSPEIPSFFSVLEIEARISPIIRQALCRSHPSHPQPCKNN